MNGASVCSGPVGGEEACSLDSPGKGLGGMGA